MLPLYSMQMGTWEMPTTGTTFVERKSVTQFKAIDRMVLTLVLKLINEKRLKLLKSQDSNELRSC